MNLKCNQVYCLQIVSQVDDDDDDDYCRNRSGFLQTRFFYFQNKNVNFFKISRTHVGILNESVVNL